MENPVNAAYGKTDKPAEKPHSMVVFGRFVPGEDVWKVTLIVGAALVLVFFLVMIFLPSGLPFLAAKNATGFVDYIGLFFLYMISFFVLVAVVVASIVLIIRARNQKAEQK